MTSFDSRDRLPRRWLLHLIPWCDEATIYRHNWLTLTLKAYPAGLGMDPGLTLYYEAQNIFITRTDLKETNHQK